MKGCLLGSTFMTDIYLSPQTVENHEGVELGALAIATVLSEVEVSDVEASHNAVRIVLFLRL